MDLNNKSILITGGTGSFGQKFTQIVLDEYRPKRLIIFSRDELKQSEMQKTFNLENHPAIRYFIGDVRDAERLHRAMADVDIVVHAAAMKQVVAAEYNPFEVIKTNVLGAQNVIDAAIDRGVQRIIALSTDKAANPINLYGAAKLCADKLFVAANSYSGLNGTRFSTVRYGNVSGSKGSVIPFFLKMREKGILPVTDERMTRFWITLDQGVKFVMESIDRMLGGELFVPKIPSLRLIDLARAIGPDCEIENVGLRPGEKLHEVLISEDDARHTIEHPDFYTILPQLQDWDQDVYRKQNGGLPCSEGFEYTSDTNDRWLGIQELRKMVWTQFPLESKLTEANGFQFAVA